MNNKRNIFIAFLLFTIMCSACKNKAVEYYEFKITDEKIQPKTNGVVVSGTYSYGSEMEGIEFNYGLDEKLTDAVSKPMNLKGFDFSVSIDSLTPNTLYYYCYKVDFGINKDYLTEIDSFKTKIASPKVITLDVTDIQDTSAVGHGKIEFDGGGTIKRCGICWNTEEDPTIFHSYADNNDNEEEFSVSINGLSSETVYFVRAYAINEIDTVYGDNKSFTTTNGGGPYTPLTVVVNATPTIIPEGEISRLTASASGGDGNYSYLWTPATSLDNPNTQSPIASPTVTTTYTCTVTSDNNTASNSCTITVVKAPVSLKAIVQNENEVLLNWTNANLAQTYRIYRNDTYLAQTDNTTYMDGNLSPDIYRYQVTSLYEGVESPKSHDAVVEIISQIPEGALEHLFTVGSNNKQIWFSSGNLQYRASTNTWRFATKQYDRIGSGNANISSTYDGWIDLFGWGTGNEPTSTGTVNDFVDWGENAIDNGGNTPRLWRTMTKEEWNYVFNERNSSVIGGVENARYVKSTVVGIQGVILFPDVYENPSGIVIQTNTINKPNASFDNDNIFSASQWSIMEEKGCVFLPAAGNRDGTTVQFLDNGYYWSSTYGMSRSAYGLHFDDSVLQTDLETALKIGESVRLVHEYHRR